MNSRLISCDICASSAFKVFVSCLLANNDVGLEHSGELMQIVKCRVCGLMYVNPQPIFSSSDTQDLYSEKYFRKEYMRFYGEGGCGAIQSNEPFSERLDIITKYKTGGRLLDVGCATGGFLLEAKKRGWEVSGVEISKYAAERAVENCSCEVVRGMLEDPHFNDRIFDVISAGDILEHMPSPSSFLSEARRILKDDGLLYLAMPNSSSFYYAFFGSVARINHRNYFVLPHHLYHFSHVTLKKALDKAGFNLVELKFSHSHSPSWWMNIFNFRNRIIAIAKKK